MDTIVGGVSVAPSDIVIGDADGVVVVPSEVSGEVLEQSEERVNSEDNVRDEVGR